MKYRKTLPKEEHKYIDAEYKKLAGEYQQSAMEIQAKIIKLQCLHADTPREDMCILNEQIKLLKQAYRSTREIGLEMEHYYERGWWRSEVYTLNTR